MRVPLVLAILLAAPVLPSGPAAGSALVADAGTSRVAHDGAALPIAGAASGGDGAYTYLWSWAGPSSRFADPSAPATTFSTSGLPPGNVDLTLTVTDGAGATASDTVRHRVEASVVLLDAMRTVVGGAFVIPPAKLPFTVPSGLVRLEGTLDWLVPANDLDLELFQPSGATATGSTGKTGKKPERVSATDPVAGSWQAWVHVFASGPDRYTLGIRGFADPTPVAAAGGSYTFLLGETQTLVASATRGAPPYTFAWDLDGDGAFEAAGASVEAALPPGDHAVRVRATDAQGYEADAVASVRIVAVDSILRLRCGVVPGTIWSMEFTMQGGRCFMHTGHHTYFAGATPWILRGGRGDAWSVEQQFAPPTEAEPGVPVRTPVVVETSLDGQEWTFAAAGAYVLLGDASAPLSVRQKVFFDLPDDGRTFRFVRVREPLSATQGLSGYLDNSALDLYVVAGADPAPRPTVPTRSLSCETGDLLEDFFPTHPCTFGGIDRYDAPSFFHTYDLGAIGTVRSVEGSFRVLPWRTDDWFEGAPFDHAPELSVHLQASVTGVQWQRIGSIYTFHGAEENFSWELPAPVSARFLRYFPDHHAYFDEPSSDFDRYRHPRAFFTHSRIAVGGDLPG